MKKKILYGYTAENIPLVCCTRISVQRNRPKKPQTNKTTAIDYMDPIIHFSKLVQNKINGYKEISLGFKKVQTSYCIIQEVQSEI